MSGIGDPRAANLAKSYRAGWVHGAAKKVKDPRFLDHSNEEMRVEYERGYADGQKARSDAVCAANERLGYEPQIMRSTDERPDGAHPACRDVKDGEQCEGLRHHALKHWSSVVGPWEQGESDSADGPVLWRWI